MFNKRLVLLVATIVIPSIGFGVPVSVSLKGTVSTIDTLLESQFSLHESVSIDFIFESNTNSYSWLCNGGSGCRSEYYALKNLSLSVGNDSFSLNDPLSYVSVNDNTPADEFQIPFAQMAGPSINGLENPLFTLGFVDLLGIKYSNSTLPTSLSMDGWSYINTFVGYHDKAANFDHRMYFNITAVESSVVHESSMFGILFASAAGLIWARKRLL